MVVTLCYYWVGVIYPWDIPTNSIPLFRYILVVRIYLSLMVVVELMSGLVLPTSSLQKDDFVETDMMIGFSNLGMIVEY